MTWYLNRENPWAKEEFEAVSDDMAIVVAKGYLSRKGKSMDVRWRGEYVLVDIVRIDQEERTTKLTLG